MGGDDDQAAELQEQKGGLAGARQGLSKDSTLGAASPTQGAPALKTPPLLCTGRPDPGRGPSSWGIRANILSRPCQLPGLAELHPFPVLLNLGLDTPSFFFF